MLILTLAAKIDKTNMKSLDFDFNISHDGEAIVMASERLPGTVKLGIDVMRVALPAGIPSIPEFEETVEDMVSVCPAFVIISMLNQPCYSSPKKRRSASC